MGGGEGQVTLRVRLHRKSSSVRGHSGGFGNQPSQPPQSDGPSEVLKSPLTLNDQNGIAGLASSPSNRGIGDCEEKNKSVR